MNLSTSPRSSLMVTCQCLLLLLLSASIVHFSAADLGAVFSDADDSVTTYDLDLDDTSSNSNPSQTYNKFTRIAVIGGGPAGLFAARQLSRAGYERVVVFEAGPNAASIVQTLTEDGYAVDFTIRFVPSVGLEGVPPLLEMIDDYGVATQSVSSNITFVNTTGVPPILMPMAHVFEDFYADGGTTAEIITQLIDGYSLLQAVNASDGMLGCYSTLGVSAGTSVQSWATSFAKPAFTQLAIFSNDVFLGGPSALHDVCVFLKIAAHFLPGDIVNTLKAMGASSTDPRMPASLQYALDPSFDSRRKTFVNGYQSFFDALVDAESFTLIKNAQVASTSHKASGRISIRLVNGTKYRFDKAVVATSPNAALSFIDDSISMTTLLSQITELRFISVNAFQTVMTPGADVFPYSAPYEFTSVLYPAAYQLASTSVPDDVVGVGKEHNSSGVIAVIGYASGKFEDTKTRAKALIEKFGYTTTYSVYQEVIAYPPTISASIAASGWFASAESYQGSNDYTFVGQAFAGYGVPSVLAETTRVIANQFLA
eukprot:c11260_g1_i1.p1 GENE.c11260_g1_i1~~c11260_g1_i1.p1  ORF type:complete len:540 (-),score=188.50 c11260_g1_i1:252-1871(-)